MVELARDLTLGLCLYLQQQQNYYIRQCNNPEVCLIQLQNYGSCKDRNVRLERSLFHQQTVDNEALIDCMKLKEQMEIDHRSNINQLTNTYIQNLTSSADKFKMSTNPHLQNLTTSVNKFSEAIIDCNKKVAYKTQQITKHKNTIRKLKNDSKTNITSLTDKHKNEIQKLSNKLNEANSERDYYALAGHKLGKNLTLLHEENRKLNEEAKISYSNISHWKNTYHACNSNFMLHKQNITNLNKTLNKTMELIDIWKEKDLNCQKSLDFCHKQKEPFSTDDFDLLRKSRDTAQKLHSNCLINKSNLLTNISHCQNIVLHHNEVIQNLTRNLSSTQIEHKTLTLQHQNCVNNLEIEKSTNELHKQKHERNEEEINDLINQLKGLKESLDNNTQKLDQAIQTIEKQEQLINELQVINITSKMTIHELLESEALHNESHSDLNVKYNKLLNYTNHKIRYLTKNLDLCLNKSTLNLENAKTISDLQQNLHSQLWDSSKIILHCISSLANETNVNLAKVIMVNTNSLLIGKSEHNKYNDIAKCLNDYGTCRTTLHNVQIKCMKTLFIDNETSSTPTISTKHEPTPESKTPDFENTNELP